MDRPLVSGNRRSDRRGWVTVFAYLGAAYTCVRAARRSRAAVGGQGSTLAAARPAWLALTGQARRLATLPANDRLASLWVSLAGVLLLLGVNKQLDLQTALTELGRIAAHAGDWYDVRRNVQVAFIACILMASLWLVVAVLRLTRGSLSRSGPRSRAPCSSSASWRFGRRRFTTSTCHQLSVVRLEGELVARARRARADLDRSLARQRRGNTERDDDCSGAARQRRCARV